MSAVEVRNVGRSGLAVSVVGLGCNNFGMRIDAAEADAVVGAALDAGITLFDTADSYAAGTSEELLGKALGARRDEAVVATKFGTPLKDGPVRGGGSSRRYVAWACEQSLRRLGVDHIDLYYQHYHDPHTPLEETLGALDDLVTQGKVRYVASSNLKGWQISDAAHVAARHGLAPFVASQVEWNLLNRDVEHEVIPASVHHGVGTIPYFPLASGVLTGKYERGKPFPPGSRLEALPVFRGMATEDALATVERLAEVARHAGRSLVELAASWLACQPSVSSVLMGATTPEQVTQNATAAGWALSPEELEAVERALTPPGAAGEDGDAAT